jgi:peptidoglycan-N-acetylglucosamine deacetylase
MKTAVLTTSWDDGHRCDVRLARMLKEHGLKATFYVAPENQEFAKEDLLSLPEIRDLSQDFEIGAHSMTHRRLPTISEQEAAREIIESKAVLEQVIGKEDPYEAGTSLHVYNHRFGFDLWQTARFVKFQPMKVLRCLEWDALAKAMFDQVIKEGGIYHIWGHSWEIDEHGDWEPLENVFRYISANPKVSYVTNGELGAYS